MHPETPCNVSPMRGGAATMTDLLGRGLARTTFEPTLRALRDRWAAAAFDAIKAEYRAKRGQAIAAIGRLRRPNCEKTG